MRYSPNMRAYLLVFFGLFLTNAANGQTSNMKVLDRAYMDVIDKKYSRAIDRTLPLLDSLALKEVEEIALAHQILSLSFCEVGKEEKAESHLIALRAFAPNEDFRVFDPSSRCKKLLASKTSSTRKK